MPELLACPRKSAVLVAPALLVAVLLLIPSVSFAQPTTADFKLNADQRVFWGPVYVADGHVPHASLCADSGLFRCWRYTIDVRESSERLRVALDPILPNSGDIRFWPDFPPSAFEMMFELQVTAPDTTVFSGSTDPYAVEVFVPARTIGVYTVTVIPTSVTDMSFRMRAKLEAEVEQATDPTALLSPNLRVIPPFEFNFFQPTVTFGPGGGKPEPTASCMADEIAQSDEQDPDAPDPEVCLRYSMGIEEAGAGRFDLVVSEDGVDRVLCLSTKCEVSQRLWDSSGNFKIETEPAGYSESHLSHGHPHYQHAFAFQLFRVEDGWRPGDPKPILTPLGPGRKLSVEPMPERMAEWRRFWPACGRSDDPACHYDRDYREGESLSRCRRAGETSTNGTVAETTSPFHTTPACRAKGFTCCGE